MKLERDDERGVRGKRHHDGAGLAPVRLDALAAKDAARVRAGKNSSAFTLLPHRLEHASSIQKLLSTRHSCTCSSYNGMTTLIDEDGHRAKRFKVRAPDV